MRRDPMMPLGAYFRYWEMVRSQTASRLDLDNEPEDVHLENARWLARNVLDPIRERFGPIRVLSWYRSPELNLSIPGASRRSLHTWGCAVDIVPVESIHLAEIMCHLVDNPEGIEEAIYEYGSWLHVGCPRKPASAEGRGRFLMQFKRGQYERFNPMDHRVGFIQAPPPAPPEPPPPPVDYDEPAPEPGETADFDENDAPE